MDRLVYKLLALVALSTAILISAIPAYTAPDIEAPEQEEVLNEAFDLNIEVVGAIESGPVILKVTHQYLGDEPIDYYWDTELRLSWPVEVTAPSTWVKRKHDLEDFSDPSGLIGSRSLSPGEKLTSLVYLHHDFSSFPAGSSILNLKWTLYVPGPNRGDRGPPLTETSAEFDLDVKPMNWQEIKALAKMVEERISQGVKYEDDREFLVGLVLWTEYKPFTELGKKMMESEDFDGYHGTLETWLTDRKKRAQPVESEEPVNRDMAKDPTPLSHPRKPVPTTDEGAADSTDNSFSLSTIWLAAIAFCAAIAAGALYLSWRRRHAA